MNKYIKLFYCMVVALLFAAGAYAAEKLQVIPLNPEETNALLVTYGNNHYLIGGSNSQKVMDELKLHGINSVAGVIPPCTHDNHTFAVEELCAQYQTKAFTKENANELQNVSIAWFEQGFSFEANGQIVAFGVEEAVDGAISYKCDGTIIPFSAMTNESAVNVRKKASTKSDRISKLQRGNLVTVASMVKNADNEVWYEVETSDGKRGYIRNDLLQYASSTAENSVVPIKEKEKPQQEAVKKEKRYIGNKKSKVFHREECKTLPSGKNQVYFDSKDYALAKGYRPCSNCDP